MEQPKNNIFSELQEEYSGKTEVLFSKRVSVEHETPELFNGFTGSFDLYEGLDGFDDLLINGRIAIPEIKFNYPDESLYVIIIYHFSKALTNDQLEKLGDYTDKNIEKEVISGTIGTQEYVISLGGKTDRYVKQTPLEAPEGFIYLDELFHEQKDGPGYTEFLNHELSFNRLKKLCVKLGFETNDEMITGVMLPIHRKHSTTGAMLVHKDVEHQYQMYKLSQNYIQGFEKETNEYAIGIAMAYDIKFNDYVLGVAKRQDTEGKDPDADNFTDQFNLAIKRIGKKNYA